MKKSVVLLVLLLFPFGFNTTTQLAAISAPKGKLENTGRAEREKKSTILRKLAVGVALFQVFFLVPLVSAQVLDLPEPPPIPGNENDQVLANDSDLETRREDPIVKLENRVAVLETRVSQLDARISAVESQGAEDPRVDTIQTEVSSLRSEVNQLKKPDVENPVSTDEFTEVTEKISGRAKWGVIFGILALIGVLGLIGTAVFKRISMNEQTKKEIKSYLATYLTQGYALESIQAQMKSAGWDPKLTDAVVNELKKVGGSK